jgi:hypothetical protein
MTTVRPPDSELRTRVVFSVMSAHLRVDEVTRLLGLEPTSYWETGATHTYSTKVGDEIRQIEQPRRPKNDWHFDTSYFVTSSNLEDHARFLLERLEPSAEQIRQLVQDPDCVVPIRASGKGPVIELSSNVLARLAALSQWTSFTCCGIEEPDEESDQEVIELLSRGP